MSQGRLQRSYLIEAADQFIALRVIGAVGDVFLGILDVAGERIKIEIFPRDGAIREHRQSSRTHLGEAANNDDCLAPAFANDRHHARPRLLIHRGRPRAAFRSRRAGLSQIATNKTAFVPFEQS